MRSIASSMLLASLVLGSGTAYAQPDPVAPATFYVCTAAAQVVEVSAVVGTAVIHTGTGSFNDCVIGPDGGLYIANDISVGQVDQHQVIRIYPGSSSPREVVVSGLNSPARALSFNVKTLYINTESSGVYRAVGSLDTDTSHLLFDPAASLFEAMPAGGHGLTFDVEGHMIIASGGKLLRSTTHQYVADYITPVDLNVSGGTPFGLALNTCQNILFTDPSSRRLRRLVKNGATFAVQNTNVLFSRKELPLNLEVDSSNRAYVLVAEDEIGTNAKIVHAQPTGAGATDDAKWISTCADLTVSTLLDLKASLSGPGAIAGLTSARAVGIAVAPTGHKLSHTFVPGQADCSVHEFNFGYHSATIYFSPNCPATTITMTAHKSLLGDVQFDLPASPPRPKIRAVPYSALGGLPLEYVLNASPILSEQGIRPSRIKYAFFTQEPIGQPGLARSPIDNVRSLQPQIEPGIYTEDVTSDFWDVGALDGAGGEREQDFSKRVVYTANLTRDCEFAGALDEPLNSNNPLFNSPQTIKISGRATSGTGMNCNGGQVRVSIVRIFTNDDGSQRFEPQTVQSNVQTGNVMESQANGRYVFSLAASALNSAGATKTVPAQFLITLSGDIVAIRNQKFSMSK